MKKPVKKRAPGGGRKAAYSKPTVKVDFRCPEDRVNEFRKSVNEILKSYRKSKNDI